MNFFSLSRKLLKSGKIVIIIMKVLFVSTYVEQKNTREIIDMQKLNAEIEQIVAREDVLRREIAAIVAEIEGSLFAFSTKIYG